MTGVYGKLPSHGDFVRRELPVSFVQPWDLWLQSGLLAARESLVHEFDALWAHAPAWRFRMPAGVCGDSEVAGVLLASQDAAGRVFPLTLATLLSPGTTQPNEAWYGAVEQAGVVARDQGHTVDALLAALPTPDVAKSFAPDATVPQQGWWTRDGRRLAFASLPNAAQFRILIDRCADGAPHAAPAGGTGADATTTDRAHAGAQAQGAGTQAPDASGTAPEGPADGEPAARTMEAAADRHPGAAKPLLPAGVAATHRGTVRDHNEDAFVCRGDIGLWAVADGAGGHGDGNVASGAIAAALQDMPAGLSAAEILAQVRLRLLGVHADLQRRAAERPDGDVMVSTVVVFMARGDHFACLWAGDSRAYLLRDRTLVQITRDHSLVQELVDAGSLAPEDAEGHPQANVITRAVGSHEALQLDKVAGALLPADVILLCTDGLFKALHEPEIARLLAADAEPRDMLDAALEAGARDNVTVVVVKL
jgi:protein phosphatase/serine/threonine-protein phosphatase Stp1